MENDTTPLGTGTPAVGLWQGTRRIKPYEELTFADNFMFHRVLTENPELCRTLLEQLLHFPIARIEPPEAEKTLEADPSAKGIRLDVYARDGTSVYDIEMQTARSEDLAQRARYYQGIMDQSELAPGEPYTSLRPSYILFICLHDPFGRGLPVYTFRGRCDEDAGLLLGDKTYKVFYNVSAWAKLKDAEERATFRYIAGGRPESSFTAALEGGVERARQNAQWRQRYMTWEQTMLEQFARGCAEGREAGWAIGHEAGRAVGLEEGRAVGLEEGKAEGIALGMEQRARDDAHELLKLGIPAETVALGVKLPLEDVLKIASASASPRP